MGRSPSFFTGSFWRFEVVNQYLSAVGGQVTTLAPSAHRVWISALDHGMQSLLSSMLDRATVKK